MNMGVMIMTVRAHDAHNALYRMIRRRLTAAAGPRILARQRAVMNNRDVSATGLPTARTLVRLLSAVNLVTSWGLTAVGQVSRGSPGGPGTGTGGAAWTWWWIRSAGSAPG